MFAEHPPIDSEGSFRALLLEDDSPSVTARLTRLNALPVPLDPRSAAGSAETGTDQTVCVSVLFSSLNFKDALALSGNRGVVRALPLIPGIDLVGRVVESGDPAWVPGDLVVLNGDGLGESRNGGFAEQAWVRPDFLVRLPEGRSPLWAAAIGTAGFTAALSVLAILDHGVTPDSGPILVTGAAGGVGSIALMLLAAAGFEVTASSGRAVEEADFLQACGARHVIDRASLASSAPPLQRAEWAAVLDSVGGQTLANALAQTSYGGIVTACGLAQSSDLPTTVLPFILRAVTLRGINSVDAPLTLRRRAWAYLTNAFSEHSLTHLTSVISLDEVPSVARGFANGSVRGRIAVRVSE